MKAFADTQINGRGFRISTGVNLRECSVVIIGSTCKICGRDFKCETDVTLHTRWRHNGSIGSFIDTLDHSLYLENVGQKCDLCDMSFDTISDLRFHKRFIHKHRPRYRKRRQKDTTRVIFKLNGVTTTDVNLDRKYLNMQSDFKYFVNTQTPDSLEKEKRQDNCAANIDLSLPDHVVDNSLIQYGIRPHKAANRYIVGKFTSAKSDAIARSTVVVGRSLIEISNTPNRDMVLGSDDSCEEHGNHYDLTSQENTADIYIKNFADNVDVHNKENSGRINERERRNIYPSENSLDVPGASLAYQRDKFDKIASSVSKQNAWSSENHHCSNKRSNEVPGNRERESLALTDSFIDSVKIAIDNKNSCNLDGATTWHVPTPLFRLNGKAGLIKANSNVDDDVQEVLRITRGNVQSDINHESPNRTEREILVQNDVSETFTLRRGRTFCPEKHSAELTTNFGPSADTFTTQSNYQFLANAFKKKMGFCLENLQRYGIRYDNELSEINNNDLEEYEINAHQDFFEALMQAYEPQYTNGLKTNDNEVAVVID